MSATHQLFGDVRDHSFSATIELRGDWFVKRCDLRYTQARSAMERCSGSRSPAVAVIQTIQCRIPPTKLNRSMILEPRGKRKYFVGQAQISAVKMEVAPGLIFVIIPANSERLREGASRTRIDVALE